jgi:hypothetical protein
VNWRDNGNIKSREAAAVALPQLAVGNHEEEQQEYEMKISISIRYYLVITVLATLITACSGEDQANSETWSLVDLISKGEESSVAIESVMVRNCGAAERKTIECSAGTSSDLSVSLVGGVQLGEGVIGSIDISVTNGLGIGRNSGESLALDTPAEGNIYVYTIEKVYRVIFGKMLVHSSTGGGIEADYAFNASCSLTIKTVETVVCSDIDSSPIIEPTMPANCVATPHTNLEQGNHSFSGAVHVVELWRASGQSPWGSDLVTAVVLGDFNVSDAGGSVWTYPAGCEAAAQRDVIEGASRTGAILVTESDLRSAGMIK